MNRKTLALIAWSLAVTPALAQAPKSCRGVPITVYMTYEGAEKAAKCRRDGLVGAIECVGEDLKNAGSASGARYPIKLTPVVEQQPDGSSRTRFDVESGEPNVGRDVPRDRRQQLDRERRLAEGQLRRFGRPLPPGTTAEEMLTIKGPATETPNLKGAVPEEIALCDPKNPVLGIELLRAGENGEWTVRRRMADGSVIDTKLLTIANDNGAVILLESDKDGNIRETTLWPDGTVSTERMFAQGDQTMSVLSPDGTVEHVTREEDGRMTHQTRLPDGTIITERRNPDGSLIETVTDKPGGIRERVFGSGGRETVLSDEKGTTVIEVDRSGNTLTARYDRNGNLIDHERHDVSAAEPGRRYFEQQLGGTDWESLPQSYRSRYADSERRHENTLLNRAQQAATEASDRRKEAEFQAQGKARDAETQRKLDAIAAEESLYRRDAAALAAKQNRRAEIEGARQKARDLQRQYDYAMARGDRAEAARIEQQQDAHAQGSADILTPTESEQRAMDAKDTVRQRVVNEITTHARNVAEMNNTGNVAQQDAKDRATNVGKWVSVGAEMQQQTAQTSRAADRELAFALAKDAEIERRFNDPKTSPEERAVLSDMRGLAAEQAAGASVMLSQNAQLTAAGYGLDVAMTVTGAKLATLGTAAVRRVASQSLARTLTERGVLEVTGVGATRMAAGATRVVAGETAAARVTGVLATDVGDAAATAAGRASRAVLGDRIVDAAKAASTSVARVTAMDLRDVPGRLRQALQEVPGAPGRAGSSPLASTQRNVANAADPSVSQIVGRDVLPQPPRPTEAARPFTADEIARLHEPGRNLTGAEVSRKVELLVERERATQAMLRTGSEAEAAAARGRPAADVQALNRRADEALAEAQRINTAIAQGRRLGADRVAASRPPTATAGPGASSTPPSVQGARDVAQGLNETAIVPRNRAPLPGTEPSLRSPDPRAAAVSPARPATLPEPQITGPRASRELPQAAPDAALKRADYASVPASAKDQIKRDMLDTLSRNAPTNPEAARASQALRGGKLAVELDPALAGPRVPLAEGRVALNPMNGNKLRTGEELAQALVQPPRPPRDAPGWWKELDTPTAQARRASADGLVEAERAQVAALERRIAERNREFIPTESGEQKQLAEIAFMNNERRALLDAGAEHQRRFALRERQQAAPDFRTEPGAPTELRRPRHAEDGQTPLRHLVEGDQDYVTRIMGDRLLPSQKRIYAPTINQHVQTMLQGRFPVAQNGNKVVLHEISPGKYIIVDGHHRAVAAQMTSQLTGRPLLPMDAAAGVESIIPASQLQIVRTSTREATQWRSIGVMQN